METSHVNFFGNSKLKPIDYDVFLKRKKLSASLASSMVSSTVTNKKDNTFTATSTIVKDK